MRKSAIILTVSVCIVCCVLLSSCRNNLRGGSSASSGNTDYSAMLCDRSTVQFGSVCARSEKAVYFTEKISENTAFSRIMFYDLESGTSGPLCGKAECTHDNEDCSAVFLGYIRALAYYDGRLYYDLVDRDDQNDVPGRIICCCDETGEKRRKIRSAAGEALLRSTQSAQGIFHLGKVIYSGGYYDIEDGEPHQGVTIASYDLNSSAEETILYEQEFTEANVSGDIRIQAVQNKLFFMVPSAEYSEEGQRPDDYFLELYCCDLLSGETERLFAGKVDFYAAEFWVTENGWLISSGSDGRVYFFDQRNASLSLWADFEEYGSYNHAFFSEDIVFCFHPEDRTTSVCILNFSKEVLLDDIRSREDYENLRLILCSDENSLYVKYFRFDDTANETIAAINLHNGQRKVLWTDAAK